MTFQISQRQLLNSGDGWDVVPVGQEGAGKSMDGRKYAKSSVEGGMQFYLVGSPSA